MRFNEYFVRIEFVRTGLMEFIAVVPATVYHFTLASQNTVYGKIVGTEVMEYLTNEIPIKSIEHISEKKVEEELAFTRTKFGLYFITNP